MNRGTRCPPSLGALSSEAYRSLKTQLIVVCVVDASPLIEERVLDLKDHIRRRVVGQRQDQFGQVLAPLRRVSAQLVAGVGVVEHPVSDGRPDPISQEPGSLNEVPGHLSVFFSETA